MAKVLGIGGVFFKSDNPDALREWYARVLGIDFFDWGLDAFRAVRRACRLGNGVQSHEGHRIHGAIDARLHVQPGR